MTIKPDDSWYPFTPNPNVQFNEPGVTIRLKLAAMAMRAAGHNCFRLGRRHDRAGEPRRMTFDEVLV